MPTKTLSPVAYQTIFDGNGDPISGGLITTRLTGLSTLATTWSDADGATPNANPIVADAYGRFVAFLSPGVTYEFDFATAAGAIFRTVAGIAGVPSSAVNTDVDGTAGEDLSLGSDVYLSNGSGGKTAGRWYLADSDLDYASETPVIGVMPAALASGIAGTIRLAGRVTGLAGVTVGAAYYVGSTAGNVTALPFGAYPRLVGFGDTTTSLVVIANPSLHPLPGNVDIVGQDMNTSTVGDAMYLEDGTGGVAGRWYQTDADNTYSSTIPLVGWCLTTASSSKALVRVQGRVVVAGASYTIGAKYYLSATAGALTTTAPNNRRVFAIADSATSLILVGNPPPFLDTEYNGGNTGAAITVNFATRGAYQRVTRTANTTVTLVFPAAPGRFTIQFIHEASATAYTVAFSPTVKFAAGTPPTFTNTSGAIDLVDFYWDGTTPFGVGRMAMA